MRLSVYMVTKDAAAFVEPHLQCFRSFADELVIAVDRKSTDNTAEICRRYADKVFSIELQRFPGPIHAWMNTQCTGDWILCFDQDELPSERFIEALPGLMADREMTHYWISRRWLAASDPTQWIVDAPWGVDWQPRFYRNIRSLLQFPGAQDLHAYLKVLGSGPYNYKGTVYHLDFVLSSEAQRRAKVELYEELTPGRAQGHVYFPDERKVELRPIPADDPPWDPARHGQQPQSGLFDRLRRRRSRPLADVQPISWEQLCRQSLQGWDYMPAVFQATVTPLVCPTTMLTGQHYVVMVEVQNESPIYWSPPDIGAPEVRLSYHWLTADGAAYEYNGNRGRIPQMLRPGQKAGVLLPIRAPLDPGRYRLQWDLVIEHVAWFSDNGWSGPSTEIVVEPSADEEAAPEPHAITT